MQRLVDQNVASAKHSHISKSPDVVLTYSSTRKTYTIKTALPTSPLPVIYLCIQSVVARFIGNRKNVESATEYLFDKYQPYQLQNKYKVIRRLTLNENDFIIWQMWWRFSEMYVIA